MGFTPKQETMDKIHSYNLEWGLFKDVKAFFHNLLGHFLGIFSPSIREAMKESISPEEATAYVLENGSDKDKEKLVEALAKESVKNEKRIDAFKAEIEAIQKDEKLTDLQRMDKISKVCEKAFAIVGPNAIDSIDFNLKNGQTIKMHSRCDDPFRRSNHSGIDITLLDTDGKPVERIEYVQAHKQRIEALINASGGLTADNLEALPRIEKDIEKALIILNDTEHPDKENIKEVLSSIHNTIELYPNQKELYKYLAEACKVQDKDGKPSLEIPYLVKKTIIVPDDNGEKIKQSSQQTYSLRLNFELNKAGRIEMSLYSNSPSVQEGILYDPNCFERIGSFHQGEKKVLNPGAKDAEIYYVEKNEEIYKFIDEEFTEEKDVVFASKDFLEEKAYNFQKYMSDLELSETDIAEGKTKHQTWSIPTQSGDIKNFYVEQKGMHYYAHPLNIDTNEYNAQKTLTIDINPDGTINVLSGQFANFVKALGYEEPFKSQTYDIKEEIAKITSDKITVRKNLFKAQTFNIERDENGNVIGAKQDGNDKLMPAEKLVNAIMQPTVKAVEIVRSGSETDAKVSLNEIKEITKTVAREEKASARLHKISQFKFLPSSTKDKIQHLSDLHDLKSKMAAGNLDIEEIHKQCNLNGYAMTETISRADGSSQMIAFSMGEDKALHVYSFETVPNAYGDRTLCPESIKETTVIPSELANPKEKWMAEVNHMLRDTTQGTELQVDSKPLEAILRENKINYTQKDIDTLISDAKSSVEKNINTKEKVKTNDFEK